MASGFFLGGAAEGMQNATDNALKRDTLTQDSGLRSRALDIQETAQKNAMTRDMLTRADTQIDNTMSVIGETITEALKAGKDPIIVQKAIQPLLQSAQSLAAKAGRDPAALENQVTARLVRPTGTEGAAATGTQTAVKEIAEAKALNDNAAAQPSTNSTDDRTPTIPGAPKGKAKIESENSLRDDFTKQSANFITIRDAKNRLDVTDKTGAGDVGLVFTFMKILDPTSTVREGEFATASNSAGIPSAVRGAYNKAIGEGRLDDKARTEIIAQAEKYYQKAALQHDKLQTQFADTARRQGLSPKNVIVDFLPAGAKENGVVSGVTPGGIPFRFNR